MPCLLVSDGRLVKTVRFSSPAYIGDPVNAVKIYNEKEVDELILLDVTATREDREPPFDLIHEVASECFMPLCYGGGIRTLAHVERLIAMGVEKVAVNTIALERPGFLVEVAERFGSQAIVASIDIKRGWLGKPSVFVRGGARSMRLDPASAVRLVEESGAGEILLTSIDRDGTWSGFDLPLIQSVTSVATVPIIAAGGAGSIADLRQAVMDAGASAVAVGSMAVYQAKDLGVLIGFPSRTALDAAFDVPPALRGSEDTCSRIKVSP